MLWELLVIVVLIWVLFLRNPIVRLEVILLKKVRNMWVPIDKLEIGQSCKVKVNAVKKSGKVVELGLDAVTISDGDVVLIADGVVTAVGEGVGEVKAELIADPAIKGSAVITVIDPITGLEVLLGNEE